MNIRVSPWRGIGRAGYLVAAVGAVGVAVVAGATPAAAGFVDPASLGVRIDHQERADTLDGYSVMVTEGNTRVRSVPPLESSPLGREAFLDGIAVGQVDGPAGATVRGAVLDVGFEIGYPVALTGVEVDIATPSLSVTNTVTAGVGAGGPNVSVSGGVNVTVIPSDAVKVNLRPGGSVERSVAKVALSNPGAYLDLSGTRVAVSGAIGQVQLRIYVRMSMSTDGGRITRVVYSDPVQL
ncbi:MspA family porin [Nocardia pseudobrasiliensis]|uniref:MspA protein n=1 Tax=Nocardia pseudobrasiliensis TaxID=45979 RepID=A0A370I9F9_9NOCA|nr:MspA family porin [Nocardia pseudobrasiliensis]RDI67365.1 MspA protein [Nocardia pseudobrasiliensis]